MTYSNPTQSMRGVTADPSQPEDKLTRSIEQQTRKIPSVAFLGLAGGAMALSLGFKIAGQDKTANFVGQWVPTILLLGIYNKIVKEERRF